LELTANVGEDTASSAIPLLDDSFQHLDDIGAEERETRLQRWREAAAGLLVEAATGGA
jgi:hypothetical protein